jgi:hypothetical protein
VSGPDTPPVPPAAARAGLPPRGLPVLYFALAHVALAVALAAIVIDPIGFSGFFYHARMLAVVHLITLGWISASILGSLYLVGPLALRTPIRVEWPDYVAFALVAIGLTGMVTHFWIGAYGGMAWSGATVGVGILGAGLRTVPAILRAPIAGAVRAHVLLAFVNIAAAAAMGVLIGADKVHPFLPGYVLTNVFAHAHLAAVGWASMMVVGVAYRLLPMVLPARMPAGRRLWLSAALLEAGAVGLFVALLAQSRLTWIFALTVAAGFAAFLWQVGWMRAHPRPRPPALRAPDPAVLHAGAALVALVAAVVMGVWLTRIPTSTFSLRLAAAYGVVGLVGFLSQIVVGMEGRLLPLLAWYWASTRGGEPGSVPAPGRMAWYAGQIYVFVLWLVGVPGLAVGLAIGAPRVVDLAAGCLLIATLIDTANATWILRHAFRRPSRP